MKYFAKVKLECESDIRSWAIADIYRQLEGGILTKPQHKVYHLLPIYLREIVNGELASRGCPPVFYAQSYCRRAGNTQGIHIDGNDDFRDSAINIPLKGSVGSKHIFYEGKYTSEKTHFEDLTFYKVNWQETPRVADILYLDSPHIVRVNCPHSAMANPFEDRWIFTMRFQENPSFEELCTKLNSTVN